MREGQTTSGAEKGKKRKKERSQAGFGAAAKPLSTMPIAKAILAEDHPSNSVVKKQKRGTPRVADVCSSTVGRAFIGHRALSPTWLASWSRRTFALMTPQSSRGWLLLQVD
jgi:hypothetical protein